MMILWTEPAVNDLEAIHSFIARDSELYASGFIEKILISVEKLVDLPHIGRKVPEADNHHIIDFTVQPSPINS